MIKWRRNFYVRLDTPQLVDPPATR
jgi:hypothetical protein